jgi:hypothetical protein
VIDPGTLRTGRTRQLRRDPTALRGEEVADDRLERLKDGPNATVVLEALTPPPIEATWEPAS